MKKIIKLLVVGVILVGIVLYGFNVRSKVILTKKIISFSRVYAPVFPYNYGERDFPYFAERVAYSKDGKFTYFLSAGKLFRSKSDYSNFKQIFDFDNLPDNLMADFVPQFQTDNPVILLTGEKGEVYLCSGKLVASSGDYGNSWNYYTQPFFITACNYVKSDKFRGLALGGVEVTVSTEHFKSKTVEKTHFSTVMEIFNPFSDVKKFLGARNRYSAINTRYLYPSEIVGDKEGDIFFSLNGENGYVEFIDRTVFNGPTDEPFSGAILLGSRVTAMAASGDGILYIATDSGLYKIDIENFRRIAEPKIVNGKDYTGQKLVYPIREKNFYVTNGYCNFWEYAHLKRVNPDLYIIKIMPSDKSVFVATKREGIFELIRENSDSNDKFYRIGNTFRNHIYYTFPFSSDKNSQIYVKKLLENLNKEKRFPNYWFLDPSAELLITEISDFDYSEPKKEVVITVRGYGIIIITNRILNEDWLMPL